MINTNIHTPIIHTNNTYVHNTHTNTNLHTHDYILNTYTCKHTQLNKHTLPHTLTNAQTQTQTQAHIRLQL